MLICATRSDISWNRAAFSAAFRSQLSIIRRLSAKGSVIAFLPRCSSADDTCGR
jgi:hypothetical protein